jgi:hypothetical protein
MNKEKKTNQKRAYPKLRLCNTSYVFHKRTFNPYFLNNGERARVVLVLLSWRCILSKRKVSYDGKLK